MIPILIVEDERLVAKDLQQTLQGMGYDAFAIASSAEEALARATEKRPELVLMDVRLKGPLDGIETAALLRERFGVAVVYLTAHTDEKTLERAKRTGPYGYLLKPVKSAELRSCIEVGLYRHGLENQLAEQRALTAAVLESVGDAVLAVDPQRRFLVANAAARALFDEPRIGEPVPEAWTTHHRSLRTDGTLLPVEEGALSRALRGETVDGLEFTLQKPGAPAPVWLEVSGRPVRDAAGKVTAAVAVYRDVTAKKRHAELYATLAGSIPHGAVVVFDPDLRVVAIDGELARRNGQNPTTLIGLSLRELAEKEPSDTSFDPLEAMYREALTGESRTADFEFDGRILSLRVSPVRDARGEVVAGFVLALDVTEERRTQNALAQREQIYGAIARHLPNGAVFLVDSELRYVAADGQVMPELKRLLGIQDFVGRRVEEVVSEANRALVVGLFRQALAGQDAHAELRYGDRFFDLSVSPILDGRGASHALGLFYDVTASRMEALELERARKAMERQSQQLAAASVTDELTGLLNRRGFEIVADQQLKASVRKKQRALMLFIDLNGMKAINDTQGHEMGDRALVETAALLRKVFRDCDVLGRLGGDEFVVLAADIPAGGSGVLKARLESTLAARNVSTDLRLSLSIGGAEFDPASAVTLDELLASADERMYADKQRRKALTPRPRTLAEG